MFYSQFILAKKGPLGTIWIAAHLERKLRKNQVADTDIGVSVDSILFPDVPIALRLSSHLLLGVVRIYSKKVNYLFHDCSETLLKIKQAFRSTAVDLPPEESTAPYHSITLPETFDLDDFELPDNGLFESNFVDHHISSREQITLQDTLNSMSYSTSQFGPDERFGDGDASQLGLDIDESLFADKVQTPMDITHNLALEEHEGDSFLAAPAATLSQMDIDGPLVHDDMHNNSVLTDPNDALPTEPIEAEINGVETTCLVKSPSSELAQAPSTPGLLQEAIPATYHDGPTLSPLRKLSPSNVVEGVGCDDGEISHIEDNPDSRKSKSDFSNLLSESVPCADLNDVRHDSNLVESEKGIQNIVGENSESLESPNRGSDTKNLPLDNEGHPENLGQGLNDGPLESITQVIDSAVQSTNDGDIAEGMEGGNSSCHILLPCSSGLKETDVPHGGDDEFARAFDSDNVPMDKQEEPKCSATERNTNLESPHPGESTINADLDKLDDAVKDNHLETLDCETSSNIQLPESFVSAPPSALETPNVMVPLHEVEVTTETEKDDESLVPVSGKKRKVMETTPSLGNGDLANLSELPRSKTSADFIPGDDDVLASILVGRKTPSLKLKPTPVQEGTTASKRSRINPRVSQSKRKVLVDDAMVMHGDVIRQQLTHTEDIRRVRRKAPCSQIEIWLIENSHFEEEMFTEPLFSGVSSELCSVVSQIYKVIETKVLKSGEPTLEACVQQDVCFVGISDRNNEMVLEPSVLSSHTEKQDCNGGPLPLSTREDQIGVTDYFALSENETGLSLDLTGAAIDVQDLGNADNAVCVDPEMDNILGPLNGKVLAEMPEVVTDLDVEKIEARADVVPNSEEEKTEFAAHVDEPMNDASIAINEKVEVPYDGRELSLVQEVCNGGTSVDTSSGVEVPKDVGNENDHTQRVPMEVDLSENLVNVEETFKESEPPALSCPNQCEMDGRMESLDKGESQIQEVEEKDEMDGQNIADTLTNNLSPPFEIHTEFLNLDDEAEPELPVEEEDNYTSTEQDRFFENSGWSSRTRAVARYLKSLFDNEDGHGRKLVAVDNLLAGKTRKEASRMFFETLVLKTKDYIQVQQDNSFGNINIKPRGKLAKSDF